MNKRIGIIIQARLASTRLPMKIVKKVDKQDSFLDIQLKTLNGLKEKLPIILATSSSKKDASLEKYSKKHGMGFFQGSEENVLERFIDCAEKNRLDAIIRVCSDNPFIDVNLLRELMVNYNNEDYLSYKINGTPAILTHFGFFCEIVSLEALKKVYLNSNKQCFEHVTNCIYKYPDEFHIRFIHKNIENNNIRCTLDTEEDFFNLKKIYFDFVKDNVQVGYLDIIKYIERDLVLLQNMKQIINRNNK